MGSLKAAVVRWAQSTNSMATEKIVTLKKQVAVGDDAQYKLGGAYSTGKGVTQDYIQATAWYKKAAEQGNAAGQFDLGELYENGEGVPQDSPQAAGWYQKAAEHGLTFAQTKLAQLYEDGHGVPKDYVQATAGIARLLSRATLMLRVNLAYVFGWSSSNKGRITC